MKYQILFSLKNNEKVFINIVCCSHDWRCKSYRLPINKFGKKNNNNNNNKKILLSGNVSIIHGGNVKN